MQKDRARIEEIITYMLTHREDSTVYPVAETCDKLEALTTAIRCEAARYDLTAHLYRQRDWSERTFGPGARTEGVLDHMRKELEEVAANPDDLSEWIDLVLLALDGAWRAGYNPKQICVALKAKQAKNEQRDWPDWRTAEPGKAIEHVRKINEG